MSKSSQQEQPLYATSYMGFFIRIYPNRIEFKAGVGSQSVPIGQIASVHVGPPLFAQIVIETTGGQKYTIPTKHKKEVKQAIYDAQSRSVNPGNTSSNVDLWIPLASAMGRKQVFLSWGLGTGVPCLLTNVCIYEILLAWTERLSYN